MYARLSAVLVAALAGIFPACLRRPEPPPHLILKGHTDVVRSVAWRPDGQALASAGGDRTVRVWDPATGQETAVFKGHTGEVYSVAWRPDGKVLASASTDNTVRLWNPAVGQTTAITPVGWTSELGSATGPVHSVAWSPDG